MPDRKPVDANALPWLTQTVNFLNAIGIPTQPAALPVDRFLPGVSIDRGALQYDVGKLVAASDLLHEAGHIAVTPAAQRCDLGGVLHPEQAFLHGGEVEAIAWSFAAAKAIAMPLTELFHPMGYRGHASALAMNFALGVYPGVQGLIGAGLAANIPIGTEAAYPLLLRWLRA